MRIERSMFVNEDGTPNNLFLQGTYEAIALMTRMRAHVDEHLGGGSAADLEAEFMFTELADAVADDAHAVGLMCGLFILANALIPEDELQQTAIHLTAITGGV